MVSIDNIKIEIYTPCFFLSLLKYLVYLQQKQTGQQLFNLIQSKKDPIINEQFFGVNNYISSFVFWVFFFLSGSVDLHTLFCNSVRPVSCFLKGKEIVMGRLQLSRTYKDVERSCKQKSPSSAGRHSHTLLNRDSNDLRSCHSWALN